MTSGTSGVSNPTATLAPFPTRAEAFFPLKAGKPSWPHLPAPSRPSSRHFNGLVLQAQPPGSTCSESPQERPQSRLTHSLSSPQDEIHTFLFVFSSPLSLPDKSRALGNKKYSRGRCSARPTSTVAPGQPLPQLWLVLELLCAGTTSDFARVYRDEDLNAYAALATVPRLLPLLSRQLLVTLLSRQFLDSYPCSRDSSWKEDLDTCS